MVFSAAFWLALNCSYMSFAHAVFSSLLPFIAYQWALSSRGDVRAKPHAFSVSDW